MDKEVLGMHLRRAWLVWRVARSVVLFIADEYRRGTLLENLRSIRKARGLSLARDMSHAELLEEKAASWGTGLSCSLRRASSPTGRWTGTPTAWRTSSARIGGGPGTGLAIIMKNSPRWLDVFFGLEKLGMYAVPVNIALRGDQLAYILDNSDASFVVIDHDLLEHLPGGAREGRDWSREVVVNTRALPTGSSLPKGMEGPGRGVRPGLRRFEAPVS